MTDDVNYIPYFSEVEDTFIRLRGKSLFLSPTDWALLASWQERGIPLHVVLASIEEVFKNHKSGARRRGINSLRYCQAEVEEQFEQYVKSRVGAHDESGKESTDRDPFGKDAIREHLERVLKKLTTVNPDAPEALCLVLLHVVGKLEALTTGLLVAERVDARMMEVALTELDTMLDQAIAATSTEEQCAAARAKVAEQMAPYKNVMPADIYDRQFGMLLAKHLRDLFAVPRLSLFHM